MPVEDGKRRKALTREPGDGAESAGGRNPRRPWDSRPAISATAKSANGAMPVEDVKNAQALTRAPVVPAVGRAPRTSNPRQSGWKTTHGVAGPHGGPGDGAMPVEDGKRPHALTRGPGGGVGSAGGRNPRRPWDGAMPVEDVKMFQFTFIEFTC